MKNILWRVFAFIVSRRPVADYLIGRATRTPYFHLDGYMGRWWLFNRYSEVGSGEIVKQRFPRLPAVRIHHILRADTAEHMHDHPWNARTIILRGGYTEKRMYAEVKFGIDAPHPFTDWSMPLTATYSRRPGDTEPVRFGEYHHISEVAEGGAWTMFITWEYVGTWGFWVNGKKVPYREYLDAHPERGP